MIRHRAWRAASLATIGVLGCGVADIDYTGKTCPCPADEWTCVGGVCKRKSGSGSSACTPLVTPAKFRVAWTTPNTIRWAWDPDPALDPTAFLRYELLLGAGDPATADTAHPDIKWTADRNAELGTYLLLHTGTAGDPVVATVTDGLSPATSYWGQLVAYDNTGCASPSAVLGARTADEPQADHAVFAFQDMPRPGAFLLPTRDLHTAMDPALAYAGSGCLAYDPSCDCDAAACTCLEFPQVGGFSVPTAGIGFDFEKTAFLEMAVATPRTSYWSSIVIGFGPDPPQTARLEAYTLTGGEGYRVLQIPLHALSRDDGGSLGQTDAAAGWSMFGVAGTWTNGSRVRIDEVRIRW